MTVALGLLAGWLIPVHLRRADLRRRDPVLLIVWWLTSMASVLLATGAGVALLLLPGHAPGAPLLTTLHDCWSALRHGSPPRLEELVGVLGLAVLLAFAARVAVVAARSARHRARVREEHLDVLRLAGRRDANAPDTLWLAHDRPLAFSVTGRRGVIVATEGLTRHLSSTAVEAVLAHERAHLTGRHHLLIATADALRTAMPFIPLFRHAPDAIRDLVELAADVAAARRCGAAAVRSALLGVSGHGMPDTALAMARDAVDIRLARLRHGTAPPTRVRRTMSCGMAGLTATTLPFMVGAVLLLGISVVACPN